MLVIPFIVIYTKPFCYHDYQLPCISHYLIIILDFNRTHQLLVYANDIKLQDRTDTSKEAK